MIISITFYYSIMFTPHNFNHLDRTSNAKMKKKRNIFSFLSFTVTSIETFV